MARIVVIHEIAANHRRVRESLAEHEVLAFRRIPDAMQFLTKNSVELIISAVHLSEGSVFDLLHWSKSDPKLREVPFVFFCAEPSELAKHVSSAVKSAAVVLGASRYIAMDEFDRESFRSTIEEVLATEVRRLNAKQLKALKDWAEQQTRLEGEIPSS